MTEKPLYLTALGQNLLLKAVTGKELKFSKVAFGAGDFDYETEKVADLTALKDWKVDLPLVDKKVEGGVAYIIAELKNFTLETGFAAKEIGIYAIDPDSGAEVLYAYRNKGEEYDYIPGGGSIVKKSLRFEYRVRIDDAPNVTFVIDYSFAHVTKEEFDLHVADEKTHAEKLDDVDITDSFWATDLDKNLHKISIEHAKKVLNSDIEKILLNEIKRRENLEEFIEIKNEIGLIEPNLFLIENFNPPTLLDATKIKVTSCAQGGKSLAVKGLDGLKIGWEYWISDGEKIEQVKISNVTISSAAILINNSNIVLTLENNLVHAYDINNCYLYRTTFAGNKSTEAMQSKAWQGTDNFEGHAANVQRTSALDLNVADITADGKIENDTFTLS